MTSIDNSVLLKDSIESLISSTKGNKRQILSLLTSAINHSIKIIGKKLDLNPLPHRELELSPQRLISHGYNFGVKISKNTLSFSKWLFDLPKMEKEALLYFLLIKSALIHYIPTDRFHALQEFSEGIINIITILWIQNYFTIKSTDNRIITAIRSRIYTKEIANVNYHYWDNLLVLLIRNRFDYKKVFSKYIAFIKNPSNRDLPEKQLAEKFHAWLTKQTIKPEDTISPIYLTPRLLKIVKIILESGYEDLSTSKMAKQLDVHENTVRNSFHGLSTHFGIYWRPRFNYEKISLYPYSFKIILRNNGVREKLTKRLLLIPYLKELFIGENERNEKILYSSNIYCPHIIANHIESILKKGTKNRSIKDFTFQLIRNREYYSVITTASLNPTREMFKKLLSGEKSSDINKLTLTHEQKDFSMEFNEEELFIDQNLLHFLSILRCRYLIKARYGVWVNEFYKLLKNNDIPESDVSSQMDFLNQLEIRARRRGLLDYSLNIRSFSLMDDILIIEIPIHKKTDENSLISLINKIRIFSFSALLKLYNHWLFVIPGIPHKHPVAQLTKKFLQDNGISPTLYTVQSSHFRFVPYHELYDYSKNRWKLKR
jgi:hypothetical protein